MAKQRKLAGIRLDDAKLIFPQKRIALGVRKWLIIRTLRIHTAQLQVNTAKILLTRRKGVFRVATTTPKAVVTKNEKKRSISIHNKGHLQKSTVLFRPSSPPRRCDFLQIHGHSSAQRERLSSWRSAGHNPDHTPEPECDG